MKTLFNPIFPEKKNYFLKINLFAPTKILIFLLLSFTLRDSNPVFPDFCRLCVLCSRDKVQPLTRVPVRATRNVKK